jgi:hypothetical protein
MGETAIPEDAIKFVDDPEFRGHIDLSPGEETALRDYFRLAGNVPGQASQELRTAGLKIVSKGLLELVRRELAPSKPFWNSWKSLTNEPRQLLRAVPPRSFDMINGQRLGMLAVDNAMAGFTDFMQSQWLTEYVIVPLKLVTLGMKRVPLSGIFWKSVLDKTGQPPSMR